MLCIAADNIWISLFIIVTMSAFTIVVGKLPFHRYVAFLSIPLTFIIMGSIAIAVDFGRNPMGIFCLNFGWFYFYVSKVNLIKAASVILKALGAMSTMYMLTLSTSTDEIITVLRRMHIPKIIIELMNMIYRFIFIIMDAQSKMHNSAQSRLGYIDFKTSVYTFGNIASNLFIVSLKKANAYYNALESRGYNGELLFLEEEKKCKVAHMILAIVYVATLVLIWICG